MPARPPLAQTVKCESNWTSDGIAVAHNIFYGQIGTGGDTTSVTLLSAIAQEIMVAYAGSGMPALLSEHWGLASVTVSDNGGGSENFGVSSHARVPGTDANQPLPPQVAICLSFQIAARYRGGKPRWYLPGIPSTAQTAFYGSQINGGYADSMKAAAASWLNTLNTSSPGGSTFQTGTISYFSGNAPRVTPVFRSFLSVLVHERLDSQRRRSGKESAFGVG